MYALDREKMPQQREKKYQILFSNTSRVFAQMQIPIGTIRFDNIKILQYFGIYNIIMSTGPKLQTAIIYIFHLRRGRLIKPEVKRNFV